jgi:putative transposase
MPRQARLDAPGTLHHVMVRGIEGQNLFTEDEDREDFLSRVESLVKQTGTRILAWALMDNHVHLLLFSGPAGLPTFMRRLLTGYAIGFNRRNQRVGYLFQNRYKSIVCELDSYLLELVRYIHLNPLRSSTVKDLEELDGYRWTGHGILMGKCRNPWQEKEYVLGFFGKRKRPAIQAYRQFIEAGIDLGNRPELIGGGLIRSLGGWSKVISLRSMGEKEAYDSRILGSGDFVQAIMEEAEERLKRQLPERKKAGLVSKAIKRICKEAGIEEKELRNGGQRRIVSKVRGKIGYYLNRELGLSLAEIARNLGVGTSAVAMAIRKLEHEQIN